MPLLDLHAHLRNAVSRSASYWLVMEPVCTCQPIYIGAAVAPRRYRPQSFITTVARGQNDSLPELDQPPMSPPDRTFTLQFGVDGVLAATGVPAPSSFVPAGTTLMLCLCGAHSNICLPVREASCGFKVFVAQLVQHNFQDISAPARCCIRARRAWPCPSSELLR